MNSKELYQKINNSITEMKLKQQKREHLLSEVSNAESEYSRLEKEKENYKKASELIFSFLERGRLRSKSIFEKTGTSALELIFGKGHALQIDYGQRGNTSTATMKALLPSEDEDVKIPVSLAHKGGGYNDVVSAAFAISQLEIIQPRLEGPLIADETFKHLNEAKHDLAGQMFRGTFSPDGKGAEGVGRQLIFNTHSKHFLKYADKIINVEILEPDQISIVSDITPENDE